MRSWYRLHKNTRMAVCASLWVAAAIGMGVVAERYRERQVHPAFPQQPAEGLFVCTNGVAELTTALPARLVTRSGTLYYIETSTGELVYQQADGEACLPRVMMRDEFDRIYSQPEMEAADPEPMFL